MLCNYSHQVTESVAFNNGTRIVFNNGTRILNPEMLTRKIKLWDINAHITCRLCEGYLIDATTVTECLHTCYILAVKTTVASNAKTVSSTAKCNVFATTEHTSYLQSQERYNLRCARYLDFVTPTVQPHHDRTMQDIVYKLVPGLQDAELKKQRDFYQKLGMEVPGDVKGETKPEDTSNKETTEEKQEENNDYHRSDEQVSICLECNSSKLRGLKRKWIRCSAQATVLHLKKFIAKKLNLASFNELDILCNEEILGKDHTLKFVVVTRWRFKVWCQVLFVKYINTSHGFALRMQPAFCQTTLTGCFFCGKVIGNSRRCSYQVL
ncbi:Polycomb group RING finger protein 3 [Acipenser ruthenus]|uniref:Polycomb group RING finger protein 3 n=1 Tax=Acipenser ruthenus TaxID=7906 RepID=A0A444U0Q7_ACIRT|nr:Polycomb group RING finger protein 3 [Acipenser ruthenus]